MALPIITADQRLAEARGVKGCSFDRAIGPDAAGVTRDLRELAQRMHPVADGVELGLKAPQREGDVVERRLGDGPCIDRVVTGACRNADRLWQGAEAVVGFLQRLDRRQGRIGRSGRRNRNSGR